MTHPNLVEALRTHAHDDMGDVDAEHVHIASIAADEIARLRVKLFDAGLWLRACLGLVEGDGPPNWDGIRDFLKQSD